MTIARDVYEDFTNLEVALSAIFVAEMDVPNELAGLFNVAQSTDAAEYHQGDQGFGTVPEYKGKIDYEDSSPLWKQTYSHIEYAKGLAIERKLYDDDKWNIINRKGRSFGMAFSRKVAMDMASVFNNAFDSDYAGADGVALCSANHDYSPVDTTEQVNYQALSLTHSNVADVRAAMMQFVDPKGNAFPVVPDTLLVGPSLMEEAQVITGSVNKSGTADNDTNTNRVLRPLVSPYLTDTNAWFLVDSRLSSMYLNWYWRIMPEFVADPSSQFDLNWRYRGYMRYSFGWDDYRWVYGCNPS